MDPGTTIGMQTNPLFGSDGPVPALLNHHVDNVLYQSATPSPPVSVWRARGGGSTPLIDSDAVTYQDITDAGHPDAGLYEEMTPPAPEGRLRLQATASDEQYSTLTRKDSLPHVAANDTSDVSVRSTPHLGSADA